MRLLLLCVLVWSNMLGLALNEENELKYLITINGENRGVLYMKSGEEGTVVDYNGISKNDKILFYAENKKFKLLNTSDFLSLEFLEVNAMEHDFIYDASKASEEMIEDSGLAQVDIAESLFIVDRKEDTLAYAFEKYAVHTMDSMIEALFIDKSVLQKPFYLYEPQSNVLLKVAFAKEPKATVELATRTCKTDVYTLGIIGKNKNLIYVYLGDVPHRIEAFSKKWSFDLIGAGKPKNLTLNKSKEITTYLEKKVKKTFKKGYKISNVKANYANNSYKTSFKLVSEMDEKEIEKHLPEFTKNYRRGDDVSVKKGEEAFTYELDYDDVVKFFAKKNKVKVKDDKFYWKTGKLSIPKKSLKEYVAKKMGCSAISKEKDEVMCVKDGKKKAKEFDIEDELSAYIVSKYANKYDKDIDLDDETKSVYKVKTRKKIPLTKNELLPAAKQLFNKENKKLRLDRFPIRMNKDKEYVITISENAVARSACKRHFTHKSLRGKQQSMNYKDEKCSLNVKYTVPQSKADEIFNENLNMNYPDLAFMKPKMHDDGQGKVSFLYLNLDAYKGKMNECHE